MKKRINSEPIIGNLLIGQKKGYISNEELYNYYDTIDQLLPEEYYTYNSISLDEFLSFSQGGMSWNEYNDSIKSCLIKYGGIPNFNVFSDLSRT